VETFDVAIVGGGLIGCSIAFELAAQKLKVVVLDKQEPGREASWAAAGMLSPAPESPADNPLVPLSRESLRIYPQFADAVESESGKSIRYMGNGTLELFFGTTAEKQLAELISLHEKLQLKAEAVPIRDARALGLSEGSTARAAAFLPDEATVEPRLLMDAILSAARNRGVTVRSQNEVTSLAYENNRCVGVVANERIAAQNVVLAAGCFSGKLNGNKSTHLPVAPTRPVRGQMLALKRQGFTLKRVLRSNSGYIVPRSDGRIVAGSTIEDAGFEKKVTAAGIRSIIGTATELCPELSEAELVESWCGLRPGSPDALPILGPAGEGLLVATGHYRNGVLLAPITAQLIREWILSNKTSFDARPYAPERFKRLQAETAQVRS
jgi:glycine oxidase